MKAYLTLAAATAISDEQLAVIVGRDQESDCDLPSLLGRDMRIVPVLHQLDEDTVAILGSDHLVQILQALIDLDSAPMAFERVVEL